MVFACLTLSVSAYVNETGAPPFAGLTASGAYTAPGVAACGPSFPFGMVFYVPGHGAVICLDRGGAITDKHLDLYMAEGAWEWGRRELPVMILWRGKP
jgi:3D (Asp-Asp-Asp) domain-containing protein